MKKNVLLNPPGKQNYLRDYYCSKVSKTNFAYEPIDLLVLSGILKKGHYDVFFIDAIVDKLSSSTVLSLSKTVDPFIAFHFTALPGYCR